MGVGIVIFLYLCIVFIGNKHEDEAGYFRKVPC